MSLLDDLGLFLVLSALAYLVPTSADAHSVGLMDGATLKSHLESAQRVRNGAGHDDDALKAQFVYGYIAGIVDALNDDTSGHFFCQPPSVTPQKDAQIVLDYIDANLVAFRLAENASQYVFDALGAVFPCSKPR